MQRPALITALAGEGADLPCRRRCNAGGSSTLDDAELGAVLGAAGLGWAVARDALARVSFSTGVASSLPLWFACRTSIVYFLSLSLVPSPFLFPSFFLIPAVLLNSCRSSFVPFFLALFHFVPSSKFCPSLFPSLLPSSLFFPCLLQVLPSFLPRACRCTRSPASSPL